MTTIVYDNVNPFLGLSPTPLVGRQVEMLQFGDRWGEIETFSLKGQITGYCPSFEDLVAKQTALIAKFSKDFQTLQLKDGNSVVFERPFVKVSNISFDQSNYAYSIPYSITLQAYPEAYFEGTFGITDPKDEFVFSEAKDGVLTISHNVSAKGFNTSAGQTNALDNARAWVQSKTGFSSQILPVFINYSGATPCLVTQSETIDRLSATHELRETFTTDLLLNGYGLLRFTVDYSYGYEDGISRVEVKGDIVGCKNGTMEQLRARYAAFDAYKEAQTQFRKITGRSDLNPVPISKGVSEDETHVRLGFSYVFTDDDAPATHFDYRVNFQYDFETDSIVASIEGTVKSNVELSIRWATVQAYANQINLYSLILPFYNDYAASIGANYPLNPRPRSTSRTENRYAYQISLAASWDNALIPPVGLSEWDYTIQFQPALHQYSATPCMDGEGRYVVFDLGFNSRAKLSIRGLGIGSSDSTKSHTVAALKTACFALQHEYLHGIRKSLDGQSITETNVAFDLSANVSANYSSEDSPFTLP